MMHGLTLLLISWHPAIQEAETAFAPAAADVARANLDVVLEGVPPALAPRLPRGPQDREALRLFERYAEARALENRNQLREAVQKLEQANADTPNHPALLRRLSRLSFAIGRPDEALAYGRKLLEIEPNDTGTLSLLVALLIDRRNDALAAEALLKEVLAHPRLDPKSSQFLVAHRHLGDLYFELLNKPADAAASYASLVAALDQAEASKLPELDRRRVLRDDPADSYLRFGEALLATKDYETALRAFERGLSYRSDHAVLPMKVSEALLGLGKGDEALKTLEPYLKRQPRGREPYELLGRILTALNRPNEFLPRLESAAAEDVQNLSLQFALIEQLRANNRADQADQRLRALVARHGDPQVYGVLISTLVKDRKPREILEILLEGVKKVGVIEAMEPHLGALMTDRELSKQVLDEAVKRVRADEKSLTRELRAIAALIARNSGHYSQLATISRIALRQEDSDENVVLLYQDLSRNQEHAEAAQVLADLFKRRPDTRDSRLLAAYAGSLYEAGQLEAAIDAAKEAARLDATAFEPGYILALCHARAKRWQESVNAMRELLKQHADDDTAEFRIRYALSSIYLDMNDPAKAIAELETVFEKDPEDPRINNDLGYLYAEQGQNLEKAERMIRLALERATPDSMASYLDSLGWVFYKQGKLEESIETLREASEQPGASATVFDHLGDASFQLQRYEAAEQAWKQAEAIAAKASPPDAKLPTIVKKLEELRALRSSGLSSRPLDP